jgi:hypothetical protein
VDLQATITEVRPDGQEEFVQQGWLKVSQRAIDEDRSTVLRPYQTHAAEDVAMLTPGEPVLARLEVFPFGHVFRAGSRLRVWVESPTVLPQLWAFAPFPTPAQVTILHDAEHLSQLVLPVVPNDDERVTALPGCDLLIRQPCRPDPLASSGGSGPSGPSGPSAPAGPVGPPTTLAPGTIDAGSPAGPGSGGGGGGATGALARTGAGDAVLLPAGVALVLAVAMRRRLRTS